MLEQLNRINYLFDIYGRLLTDRQQEVLQYYFSEDYSLSEIAGHYAISRQAVHDLIRRAVESLEKLEHKLGLYVMYENQNKLLDEADRILLVPELTQAQRKRLESIIRNLKKNNDL